MKCNENWLMQNLLVIFFVSQLFSTSSLLESPASSSSSSSAEPSQETLVEGRCSMAQLPALPFVLPKELLAANPIRRYTSYYFFFATRRFLHLPFLWSRRQFVQLCAGKVQPVGSGLQQPNTLDGSGSYRAGGAEYARDPVQDHRGRKGVLRQG